MAAIICAAGASTRMGDTIKKEYRPLSESGMTVLGAAVQAFAEVPEIETIVIAVPQGPVNGESAARAALPPALLAEGQRVNIQFVGGGATRQASVFNALSLLAARHGVRPGLALIHDGARPWVSPALIRRVIAAAIEYRAAIPLLPLTETPKETDVPLDASFTGAKGDVVFVKRHLSRAFMGGAQTPQGFAFPAILAAHRQAEKECPHSAFTDDAEIWARFCGAVAAIPGEAENRKITFPEDIPY